jgi:hypothetical protein
MKASPRARASVKRTTRAIKPIDEESVYTCVLCRKNFSNAEGFKAHHVHVFTESERCLDSDELRALDFAQRKNGVWATDITTQLSPSQIARLASVRPEIERLVNAGGADPQGTPF